MTAINSAARIDMGKNTALIATALFYFINLIGDARADAGFYRDVDNCTRSFKFTADIDSEKGELSVVFLNKGRRGVVVNRRFSIEPVVGEVDLDVRMNGRSFEMTAMLQVPPPRKDDLIELLPGQLVGSVFSLERISRYYSLQPGRYELRAIYSGVRGGASDVPLCRVKSNLVYFEIKNDS